MEKETERRDQAGSLEAWVSVSVSRAAAEHPRAFGKPPVLLDFSFHTSKLRGLEYMFLLAEKFSTLSGHTSPKVEDHSRVQNPSPNISSCVLSPQINEEFYKALLAVSDVLPGSGQWEKLSLSIYPLISSVILLFILDTE